MNKACRWRAGCWTTALLVLVCGGAARSAERAPADSTAQAPAPATSAMARPSAAPEQTVDRVRWLARRRQFTWRGVPYGFTGLPIFYYGVSTGWNYGARLQWVDYQRQPYRYKMILHLLRSTEGKIEYIYRLRVPRISGTGFGLRLLVSSERQIRARYYGEGNGSVYHKPYVDPGSPEYRDKNYYIYVLEEPRFIFSLLRQLYGPMALSVGFGVERTDVSPRGPLSYYRQVGTPDNVVDGVTGFASATLEWDSRDDENVPQRGTYHEWSYESSRNSLFGLFFQRIDFARYTFTDARHWPLSERANLAHRTTFEVLDGTVPLYAYGELGGSRRVKGLGGSETLRGFDAQRFTDDVRFFTNTELRYRLHSHWSFKQYLEWHGVLFGDTGRVWPRLGDVGLSGPHMTAGAGLRCYWNNDFVIRLDLGFSREQVYVALKYRNLF